MLDNKGSFPKTGNPHPPIRRKKKKVRRLKSYDVWTEEVSSKGNPKVIMRSAYSKSGVYIGSAIDAFRLANVYGIASFEKASSDANGASIGYSPKDRKWYGWSHRAIHGFGIGSRYRGRVARFMSTAKQFAAAFARSIA